MGCCPTNGKNEMLEKEQEKEQKGKGKGEKRRKGEKEDAAKRKEGKMKLVHSYIVRETKQ